MSTALRCHRESQAAALRARNGLAYRRGLWYARARRRAEKHSSSGRRWLCVDGTGNFADVQASTPTKPWAITFRPGKHERFASKARRRSGRKWLGAPIRKRGGVSCHSRKVTENVNQFFTAYSAGNGKPSILSGQTTLKETCSQLLPSEKESAYVARDHATQ